VSIHFRSIGLVLFVCTVGYLSLYRSPCKYPLSLYRFNVSLCCIRTNGQESRWALCHNTRRCFRVPHPDHDETASDIRPISTFLASIFTVLCRFTLYSSHRSLSNASVLPPPLSYVLPIEHLRHSISFTSPAAPDST